MKLRSDSCTCMNACMSLFFSCLFHSIMFLWFCLLFIILILVCTINCTSWYIDEKTHGYIYPTTVCRFALRAIYTTIFCVHLVKNCKFSFWTWMKLTTRHSQRHILYSWFPLLMVHSIDLYLNQSINDTLNNKIKWRTHSGILIILLKTSGFDKS